VRTTHLRMSSNWTSSQLRLNRTEKNSSVTAHSYKHNTSTQLQTKHKHTATNKTQAHSYKQNTSTQLQTQHAIVALSLALPKWSDQKVGVVYFINISDNLITGEIDSNK